MPHIPTVCLRARCAYPVAGAVRLPSRLPAVGKANAPPASRPGRGRGGDPSGDDDLHDLGNDATGMGVRRKPLAR